MTRKEAIDKLVAIIEKRNYGEILNYDEIGGIIELKYGTVKYSDIIQAARKQLITTGHMIVNVRGVGYKVCQPDNYTGEGVRHMRCGARQIDKGVRIISHAPVNDMSQHAREAHNRVADRMMRLQAAMAGASVEIHMLNTADKNPLLQANQQH